MERKNVPKNTGMSRHHLTRLSIQKTMKIGMKNTVCSLKEKAIATITTDRTGRFSKIRTNDSRQKNT
jgi:hypothetical protein